MSTPALCASILADAVPAPATTVAIVADGRLSVAALETLLLRDPRYRVVERARGADQLRQVLSSLTPMLAIVESRWSTWRQTLDSVECSARTLLLVDPDEDPAEFVQAVRAGADGYLSRTASRDGFTTAIDAVRQSGSYLDPRLADQMRWASTAAAAPRPAGSELSPREREILARVANGHSSKQIAREYALAPKTVCNHVTNIARKLQLRHRGQLVIYAAQHGLATL
jgi:DNA-binding NarL/FixJ family response regulator